MTYEIKDCGSQPISVSCQGQIKEVYKQKTFIGDGSGDQDIVLDGNMARVNSVAVYFAGILGEPGVDWTLAVDKKSVNIAKVWATGRGGLISYVID